MGATGGGEFNGWNGLQRSGDMTAAAFEALTNRKHVAAATS